MDCLVQVISPALCGAETAVNATMHQTSCFWSAEYFYSSFVASLFINLGFQGVAVMCPSMNDLQGAQESSLYDHAAHARWLIHEASYGVAAAQSSLKEGYPFGNILSVSDGPVDQSTGRIIFYVATMSQFAKDVAKDDRVSFTVSQEQAEGGTGCRLFDPEWPMCARVLLQPSLAFSLPVS
jgi:Pyridoxamine 5'-phosphate oxidase